MTVALDAPMLRTIARVLTEPPLSVQQNHAPGSEHQRELKSGEAEVTERPPWTSVWIAPRHIRR
jgi:hypothetical protein